MAGDYCFFKFLRLSVNGKHLMRFQSETYNHGQKSWNKFSFVALFHTRQTNSHARIHLNLFTPPPSPTMLGTCTRYFFRVSTLYCRGRGARILKQIAVLFENSVLQTQKIYAFTQASQGLLSRIVGLHSQIPPE